MKIKRIYHPWHKWECYKAGFYATSPPDGISSDEAKNMYRDFLSNNHMFESALIRVINEWVFSCEHFLTNTDINRIAWLGQSSACMSLGLPSKYKSGFNLLSLKQQKGANLLAERYLELWKEKFLSTLESGKNKDIQLIFQM